MQLLGVPADQGREQRIEPIISAIRTLIALSGRHLFLIAFASTILGFLPDSILGSLGLVQYRPVIRSIAAIASLFLLASIIFEGVLWLYRRVRSRAEARQLANRATKRGERQRRTLKHLTPVQQAYLKRYVDGNTKTVPFRIGDGVVAELCKDGILHRASSISRDYDYFDYNIDHDVFEYLKAHPEVLGQADQVLLEDEF